MKYHYWKISAAIMRETEVALQRGRHEVFAIWTAPSEDAEEIEQATISRCVIPEQEPGETPDGVYVHIKGSELQRIQYDNYDRREWSVVQLHTHPGADVRMSPLDREWESVKHVGALSIIVPHYCGLGLARFSGANVYEREEDDWRLWSSAEVQQRLVSQ